MKKIPLKFLFLFSILFFGLSGFTKKNPSQKITVYVFLSETCPICQSYTLTLKELSKKYSDKNVLFIGVFPNYYADSDEIEKFKNKYALPFSLIIDGNATLTKRLGATVTPEVFVENTEKQILYSGRIDDTFYALGKRRTVISSKDLENALDEITNNKNVSVSKTQAVGCIINASK